MEHLSMKKDLVNRVFNFTDLKVSALMTPRTKIEWLDNQKSNDYNMDVLINSSHSWLLSERKFR